MVNSDVVALTFLLPRYARQAAKSAALVACGVGSISRRRFAGRGCVLTFHGLRPGLRPAEVGDGSLHLPTSTFRAICADLAARSMVMPLREMAAKCHAGETLPDDAVAITFDDGYASNYEHALPILKEFGLPATVFLATGFIDGEDMLWFQRVDRAFQDQSSAELERKLAELKRLPNTEMRAEVMELEARAGLTAPQAKDLPAIMRPMTWKQARAMRDTGLIEFGAHTRTHPILAQCTRDEQWQEIIQSRDRLQDELGPQPTLFAFPNGGPEDYTEETLNLLAEAGFDTACTMINGHLTPQSHPLELPRYGSPESRWEAAATVSGAFELFKEWRQRCRSALGGGL
ncbi:MAG: polysaccharide deacetylase family protein [Prosthecobacter sp.]|nr:polysaccharide deacetylase family protein [Prosthecobacter sp.]